MAHGDGPLAAPSALSMCLTRPVAVYDNLHLCLLKQPIRLRSEALSGLAVERKVGRATETLERFMYNERKLGHN